MKIIKEAHDPDKMITRYSALANEIGKMLADTRSDTELGGFVIGACVEMALRDRNASSPAQHAAAIRGFKQGLEA
jgi:hypothetical protein